MQEKKFGEFIAAQDAVYEGVRAELRVGRKETHWMWFVFPQLAGLGLSAMAKKFSIGSLEEARAYLNHPVLGSRLRECTELVLAVSDRSIREIFGEPDDMKYRSCMTLFAAAAPQETLFGSAFDKYFGGDRDPLTLRFLQQSADKPL